MQARHVQELAGAGDDKPVARALIQAFGFQHLDDAGITDLEAPAGKLARTIGDRHGLGLHGDRARIVLDRGQQISHLAKSV